VLRHTFATEALRRGMSLPAVQKLLGHRDIKVTQVYLHLLHEDVKKQYEQAFSQSHSQSQQQPINQPLWQYWPLYWQSWMWYTVYWHQPPANKKKATYRVQY